MSRPHGFASRRPSRRLRVTAGLLLLLLAGGLALAIGLAPLAMVSRPPLTGWVLCVLLVLLASYGVRKRVPFLPVGRMSTWRRLHLGFGVGACALFALHAGWPGGSPLRLALWCVFAGVAGSGLVGWGLSRTYPLSLSARGEEVVYEEIPRLREQLRESVQALVLAHPESHLTQLYVDDLHPWLTGPRDACDHLRRLPGAGHEFAVELGELAARREGGERAALLEVASLVRQKQDLDRHAAQQGALKAWLWIHVPLTWVLLTGAAVHVGVVHAFGGGL